VYLRRVATVRLRGMRALGEALGGQILPEPGQAALRRTFVERWAANDRRAYLAALGAIAIGAVLAHQVFDFEFSARWSSVPLAMLAGAALSMIAGWFSLKSVVDSPPLATLRNI